jgi:ATP-dependent DNA helicase DinG
MSALSDAVTAAFAPDGALAHAIDGFRCRPQQLEMAQKIAEAVHAARALVAEAGTGTGKTYAYLVPALLSGGKVIVSTGTKNLQDQLFTKDIPTVRQALKVPVQVALLKGRSNYVCHYHLERALADGRFVNREDAGHARLVSRFAGGSKTGDKAECPGVPEDSTVWPLVTSTRENCLGQECPHYKNCFVMAARREAMAADVIVVNHHLFFADVMLRDEGMAELLPACNTVVFDEAHQLPETAQLFFGQGFSTSQVIDLARDSRNEGLAEARDCLDLQERCRQLEKAARDLRLVVGSEPARYTLAALLERDNFDDALIKLENELQSLNEVLETQAERSEGLEKCWQRAGEMLMAVTHWRKGEDAGWVRWGEAHTVSLQLQATPLDIADIFARQMGGHPRAWIFTSATLAVQGDFTHYRAELGLADADTGYWESPFDYGNQAILYAPENLPDPNAPHFTDAVLDAAWPVVKASGGRAFFLCTSLRAMRRLHGLLEDKLNEEGLMYPLLLQGEGSKNELLDRFRKLGNAILVGSQSFWEGVDVRGEALSLVVIDKLPFAPPDDPVLSARIDAMKKAGRNAFMEYQLPRAVISIKQGAGRLIRDESDHGVLMICDPRLITKHYGKRIWRSLPPMRRTRKLADVIGFFAGETSRAGA